MAEKNKMSNTIMTGTATPEYEKIRVLPDFYVGQVTKVRTKKDDGTEFISKFGKKAMVEFQLFERDKVNGTIKKGSPVLIDGKPVTLAYWVYITYKNEKTGVENSALGKNGKPTKFFEALGWTWQERNLLDLDSFIGCHALITVIDVTKNADGKPYDKPFSVIDTVSSFTVEETNIVPKKTNVDAKIAELHNMVMEGVLTKEGVEKAKEKLLREN